MANAKLIPVTFLKEWRGHAKGAAAELTVERVEDLLADATIEILAPGKKAAEAVETDSAKPARPAKPSK